MKLNPYEELAVSTDADTAAIRKAYRKRSKETHPDNGGSEEQFALTKLSHDILVNPSRRARYDSTGDISEEKLDQAFGLALQNISIALDEVLGQIINQSGNPIHFDLKALMIKTLSSAIDQLNKQIEKYENALKVFQSLQGRWKLVTPGNDQVERLEPLIAGKITNLQDGIDQARAKIKTLHDSINLLKNETFTYDARNQAYMPTSSTGAGTVMYTFYGR